MKLKNCKKAFTLAEVLITLSILGVIAALTIPSLVNRNSDVSAIVKLKKAIATYERVTGEYFAESGKNNLKDWTGTKCVNIGNYFKIVDSKKLTEYNCQFITSDGVYWAISPSLGTAFVYDSEKKPRYGVFLWTDDGNVNAKTNENKFNSQKSMVPGEMLGVNTPVHNYYSARKFLILSVSDLVKGTDGKPYLNMNTAE